MDELIDLYHNKPVGRKDKVYRDRIKKKGCFGRDGGDICDVS
jgi:hypothetical protein